MPPLTSQPPSVAALPVVVKGTNSGKTKLFSLEAGDYSVVVKGKSTGQYGGNVMADLYDSSGNVVDFAMVNEIVNGRRSFTFSNNEYNLDGGQYYLDVTMPSGSWSITFSPQ